MNIAIYSRKSVLSSRGESIENQVELCRQYIHERLPEGKDAHILVFEDEGFSGRNLERPRFQEMLAAVRRGEVDAVVCYRLDRISRSVGDFAPLAEELMSLGVGLICIREQFDTSTPMGKAMMYIASVFAQLERETIAQRVRDNMRMLSRDGRWLGGPPPTGYRSRRVEVSGLSGKEKTFFLLEGEPEELETVSVIFRRYLDLGSLRGTARQLAREGVRGREGRPYSLPGLKDILRNPVYCAADREARDYFLGLGAEVCFPPEDCSPSQGLLAYNKRSSGKKHSRLDPSHWIISRGQHPAVVGGGDWIAVQRLLASREEKNPRRTSGNHSRRALLSGRIFCGKCGAAMTAKRRSANPEIFDYICSAKLRGLGDCRGPNLNGPRTDRVVWELMKKRLEETPLDLLPLLEGLRRRLEGLTSAAEASPQSRLEKGRREMEGLLAALAQAQGIPGVVSRITGRMEELEEELARLEKQTAQAKDPTETSPFFLPASLMEFLPFLSPGERQELAAILVQRVRWDGEELEVSLYR